MNASALRIELLCKPMNSILASTPRTSSCSANDTEKLARSISAPKPFPLGKTLDVVHQRQRWLFLEEVGL